ncbi:hypothetical protein CMV_028335 [Castanea mollissima]|uniref:Uncharacterized protein n=1 Tax=Castanea mollissima TaxID=60419 RepID=A0A8J4Q920_9ROSI|nr:hypothetical protein CMV_028335 [Castanea mollissima]
MKKVQKWRRALTKASNFTGHHYKGDCGLSEFKIIQDIFEEILSVKLDCTKISATKYLVGIDSRKMGQKSQQSRLLCYKDDPQALFVNTGLNAIRECKEVTFNWMSISRGIDSKV